MLTKINFIIFLLLINVLFISCQSENDQNIFIIKGSESFINILKKSEDLQKISDFFYSLKSNPAIKFHFIAGGSTRALSALIDQTTDIAIVNHNFKFDLKIELKKYNLNPTLYAIARTEIYFIVNKANPIRSLKLSQLQNIFLGVYPTWNLDAKKNNEKKDDKSTPISQNQTNNENTKKTADEIRKERIRNFDPSSKILLVGRKISSGNNYWVSKKVLSFKPFTRELHTFSTDLDVYNSVMNNRYAIGYITNNYFKSSNTFEKLHNINKASPKEKHKMLIGNDVKRILVYNNLDTKEGQAAKSFVIKPKIYLIISDKIKKNVEPIINFFYSESLKKHYKKNGLIPLNRSEKNKKKVFKEKT